MASIRFWLLDLAQSFERDKVMLWPHGDIDGEQPLQWCFQERFCGFLKTWAVISLVWLFSVGWDLTYAVFVGIIINHKPRLPGSLWNNQHSTERNTRFFDHGENLVQDKVSDSKPLRIAPGPTIATGHISPPETEMYGKKVIQLCLQTEKNSTVSNLTIWFCKWLRGDLFYGGFTGPKCFSKTRKPTRSSTWPLCDLCMLMNFMNTDLLFFFLPNWIFLFLTGRHPSLSRMKNQLIRRSLFGLAWHFNEGLAQDL